MGTSTSDGPDLGDAGAVADSGSGFGEALERAREGDRSALGRVLDGQRDALRRSAEAGLGADLVGKVDHDDLVQEALMVAGRDFGQFHGATRGHLRGWLGAILRHRLADIAGAIRGTAKRDPARERPIAAAGSAGPDALATSSTSPSGRAARSERATAVRAAVDELSEADGRVVALRSRDQLSFEEIGERLGISRDAAEKRWQRALRQLRNHLGPGHDPS